jgi:hypothetical protein
LKHEVAGDPISGQKWTRKTTEKISDELLLSGISVHKNTVARILKLMGFSLKVNSKKIANGGKKLSKQARADNDFQFENISELRESFAKEGNPIISVDTKKKEIIGNFKSLGYTWEEVARLVYDHDFKKYGIGIAIPYSIYDTVANIGSVFVGISHDTPSFAVDCIVKWWELEGSIRYKGKKKLLILADSGGSNSSSSRVWKTALQEKLCDQFGLNVNISHYPPGKSKWNPADHRLHSEISKNWAGIPLLSNETVLKYIRTTKTKTGLKVNSYFVRKHYEIGEKVSDFEMEALEIHKHDKLPKWNYDLAPREMR